MVWLRCTGWAGALVVILLILWQGTGWAQNPIDNGLSCLAARQDPQGFWGDANGTALRDTAVVVDTLRLLGQRETVFSRGVTYLQQSRAPNQDYFSRQMATLARTGSPLLFPVSDLLAGQNSETFVVTAPNYPEGGWGASAELGTDALTTALALNALKAVGFSTGLTVVKAVVRTGTPNTHQFAFPAEGSNLQLLIRQTSGSVRLWIQTPTSKTFYVDLPSLSSPASITGLPEEAGTYILTIETFAEPSKTYSLEARFEDAGFDVSRLTRALSYLGFAQNDDGSWGIRRGEDGLLMITAEVLLTLEGYGSSFAPSSVIEQGLTWLKSRQNPDGSFGSDSGVGTVHETALVVLALLRGDAGSPAITSARNFLSSSQGVNGCWNNDAYQTALAIRALPGVCRLDVDQNGTANVGTDIVYIIRHLLGLTPVPASLRVLDPSIPPDATIAGNVDALGNALDVDGNGTVDVATDMVYIARHRQGLLPVPESFRAIDPSIKPDADIAAAIETLCP